MSTGFEEGSLRLQEAFNAQIYGDELREPPGGVSVRSRHQQPESSDMAKIKLTFEFNEELEFESVYEKVAQATGGNNGRVEEISEAFFADNKYQDLFVEIVYDTETREVTKKVSFLEES